jgi:choline dehydrogenase-like flavoprotein
MAPADAYDLILVGTGFASSFFLMQYARRAPRARVLVLERGDLLSHADYGRRRSELSRQAADSFANATPDKRWVFKLAFGGTSHCWVGNTPRLTPEDFVLASRYGVGADWPISYDDLEPYYCDAEDVMAVSGPLNGGPWPRSRPYPQGPHRWSDPDARLQASNPALWCEMPCARPTRPTASGRTACCATGVCAHCPVDSKFTVVNELRHLYGRDEVVLNTGAQVVEIEHAANAATGVRWIAGGRDHRATGAVVALGANAIFNPHLLLRSGLEGPEVGLGLAEQISIGVDLDLDGVDGFGGSTLVTALGYPLHDGPHRARHAAALIESHNLPIQLRDLRGRWRQALHLRVVVEDLRQPHNRVTIDPNDPDRPVVTYRGRSTYADAALAALPAALPKALRGLPIEAMRLRAAPTPTVFHVQCTTPMGSDPASSVVDRDLRHHRLRNLLVLGASVFPTCPPANPTLTLSALSLRAADRLLA